MEDLMIIGGFGLFFLAAVFFIVHKLNKIRIERERVILEERKRQIEETRKWRKKMYERMKTESPSKSSVPPRGKETTKVYAPTHFASPTQSVRETRKDDDGMDLLTGMLIMNAITDHKQSAPSSSWSSSSSDDDSDSRKSSSSSSYSYDSGPSYKDDSPSSSWSSSSSDSSSSWSSSDSGPSSDW